MRLSRAPCFFLRGHRGRNCSINSLNMIEGSGCDGWQPPGGSLCHELSGNVGQVNWRRGHYVYAEAAIDLQVDEPGHEVVVGRMISRFEADNVRFEGKATGYTTGLETE